MGKLKEILLIDDSKGTNSLNKRLLKEMDVVEHISTALNGRLALDYLLSKNEQGNYPSPDIIFLDINMPIMDGYQFLKEFKSIEKEEDVKRIIVTLTTSISKENMEKTMGYSGVKGYQFKPLTKEKVNVVIEEVMKS
jgi:CheY-like chemotaxis protein